MSNDNFLIEEHDLEIARDICKEISSSEIRNRAVANALAADIAKKYFTENNIDTTTGIHNISQVLNNIDISDIYINGVYIDVRLHFNYDDLFIPQEAFDMGIQPTAYMFIKIDEELFGASVSGFILPSSVDTSISYDGYYRVDESDLISFYDIKPLLITNYDEGIPEGFEEQIFNYLDGVLKDTSEFYSTLLASEKCRMSLKDAAYAQNVFNFISLTNQAAEGASSKTEENVEPEALTDSAMEVDLLTPLEDNDTDVLVNDILDDEEDDMSLLEEAADMNLEADFHSDILENNSNESTSLNDGFENDLQNDLELYSDNEEQNDILVEENDLVADEIEDVNIVDATDEATEPSQQDTITEDIIEENDFNEEENADTVDSNIYQDENQLQAEAEFEADEELLFETNTTPSIHEIEQNSADDDLDAMLNDNQASLDDNSAQTEEIASKQELEDLFVAHKEENSEESNFGEDFNVKPSGSKAFPIVAALVIIAGLGYYSYTKFFNPEKLIANLTDTVQEKINTITPPEVAMPVETIETPTVEAKTEEGNAISIPAIEQSLDASVMVSNLTISWEVPSGYVTNTIAKKYLTKMGKIIQLNLKTELMLLNKQPIANKMMVELEFDKNLNKFIVKGIMASSGEKAIDDIIVQTVENAMNTNIKTNKSSFGDIAGNPILIIRL